MADYWKSQARKFCDFCKCWIADNKPSIEFHENGKKHKENVKKRLSDIYKKNAKDAKAKKKYDNDIQQMEKAAMAAYLKDVQGDTMDITAHKILADKRASMESGQPSSSFEPQAQRSAEPSSRPYYSPAPDPVSDPKPERVQMLNYNASDVDPLDPYAAQKLAKIEARDKAKAKKEKAKAEAEAQEKAKVKEKEEAAARIPVRKVWYEAKSQGHSYYWNIDTNESIWEPPPEGFMSIAEQAEEAKEQALQEQLMKQIEQEGAEEKAIIDEERRANAEREKLKEKRKQFYEKQRRERGEEEKSANSDEDVGSLDAEPEEEEEEQVPYRRDYSVPLKPQPYGSWTVVKKVKQVDLQLPKVNKPEVVLPTFTPPPRISREFKEKVITSIAPDSDEEDAGGSSITFKRKKLGNKCLRKRFKDD